jgi:hypothetical protein
MAFKKALEPLMEQIAPDWILHHIEMRRHSDFSLDDQKVTIILVIKPIGSANFVDPDADLRTGPRRIK